MNIVIGWPEGIYLGLNMAMLAIAMLGENRAGSIIALLMWVLITLPLLYWGGFFA